MAVEEDVAAIDRILTRVALTDDDKLEGVLAKLLPAVIAKLAGASPALQRKVLELLSHVNKRVKALPALQLPLHELVALFVASPAPLVRNFALVYLETTLARAPPAAGFAEVRAAGGEG